MKNLLTALFKFNQKCPPIGKSADNPFFKSKYATLDAIQHHIKPYLQENLLTITQANKMIDGMPVVETIVWHTESGECISSIFPVVVTKATAQDYGSAVSYAKRYSLSGILNLIIEDEDDDGNKASGNTTNAQTAPAKEWLNESHPKFAEIKQKISSGTATMNQVRSHFNVSKAVEAKLNS